MPKSKPTAKTTAKTTTAKTTAKTTSATTSAPASTAKPATAKASAKTAARSAKSSRERAQARARTPRFSDSEIDLTPVRIVDDRRFSGKFQIVEDEGEKRMLGWGFPSVQAARRWIDNRNHLSAWLRFILRGE